MQSRQTRSNIKFLSDIKMERQQPRYELQESEIIRYLLSLQGTQLLL